MALITYDEFIKKHLNKAVDVDGVASAQCVDLATAYFDEVFGSGIKNFYFDAHHFWELFDNNKWLKDNFTKIANTPEFVPQKGDVVVWSGALSSGGWGHIAIADGVGDTTYFYSYDQNWTGNHDACVRIKHNYKAVYGVLRAKDQSRINPNASGTIRVETKDTASGPIIKNSKQCLVTDISEWQTNVNYTKLSKEVSGVIIRVGYRGYGNAGTLVKDKLFDTHIKGVIANKIPYGFYFFSQAKNEAEGREEAEFTYNIIKNYKPTCPVYFDSEYSTEENRQGRADNISKTARTNAALGFCKKIKEYGLIPGIYASQDWFPDNLIFNKIKSYSIWVAKYSSNKPTTSNYDAWQYTSEYKFNAGYTGDMSYFYKYFTKESIQENNSEPVPVKPEAPKVSYKTYYANDKTGVNYRATPNGALKGTTKYGDAVDIVVGSEVNNSGLTWVKRKDGNYMAKNLLSETKPNPITYKTYYVTDKTGLNIRVEPNGTVKGEYKYRDAVEVEVGSEVTKNNTVWVKTKSGYYVAKNLLSTTKPSEEVAPFKVGNNYKLTVNVNVRTNWGTNSSQKLYSQLTTDGKNHAFSQYYAVLKTGTAVTVLEVKQVSSKEYWGRIPSGWICLMYNGNKFVK